MIPLISIIIPVYNTEKYLRRCLDSIVAQTYKDFECILVDDGSTDDSGKICDDYAILDNRFKVFHKKNGGAPHFTCKIHFLERKKFLLYGTFPSRKEHLADIPQISFLLFS